VNLYRHSVGETVTLTVLRGEKKHYFQPKVSERSNDPDRFADMVRPAQNEIRQLGILAIDLDDKTATMIPGLRKRTGIVVAATSLESPAFQSVGLFPGDVIYSVNGAPVARLSELRETIATMQKGDTAVLHIQRRGALVYVPMEIQ
jgi:S1-C subfamily serine protease